MRKTYSVKSEGFNVIRKRFLLTGGLFIILVILGLVFIIPLKGPGRIFSLSTASTIFLLIGCFAFYRALKRLREVWSTYKLTIDSDYILKQQSHYRDIKIEKDEIKAILKTYNGDITVKSQDWRKLIIIPRSLDGIEDVENLLNAWKPVKVVSKRKLIIALSAGFLFFFGALVALRYFLLDQRPSLTTILIALIVIMTVHLFIMREMWKSPLIDERSKPKRWHFIFLIGYLVLVLIIVISIFIKRH